MSDLLRHCLNGYGHQSLDGRERKRWEAAFTEDEDAFVKLFGPDKIADNLGEFLGYFMIRKVMAGEEFLRAAGTVTKKLAKWLGEHGYLDAGTVDVAAERAADASRDLPQAERLSRLLYAAGAGAAALLPIRNTPRFVHPRHVIDELCAVVTGPRPERGARRCCSLSAGPGAGGLWRPARCTAGRHARRRRREGGSE